MWQVATGVDTRSKRMRRLQRQTGPPQFVAHPCQSGILLLGAHGERLISAGLADKTVAQIFNLLFRRFITGGVCVVGWGVRLWAVEGGRRLQIGDTAGCKPALRLWV